MGKNLDDVRGAATEMHESGMVSRRGFLRGIVCAATSAGVYGLLPRVEGGYLAPVFDAVGPTPTYAAEAEQHFEFTVVGADQVGFHVVDVSDENSPNGNQPVNRAQVVLTSRYNKKSVSGETDEEGKVILSIADLAIPHDDNTFECNVAISVTTPRSRTGRMRDFSTGLVPLEGASGVVIGMHRLESDDDVYLERATFDDWDILYTKNEFTRSLDNDIEHVIHLRFKGLGTSISVTMTPYDASTGKKLFDAMSGSTTSTENDLVEVRFKGKFLLYGTKQCLSADEVKLHIEYTWNSKTISYDLLMNTIKAPLRTSKYTGALEPFFNSAGNLGSFTAEGNWPCFNGATLSIVDWNFPVQMSLTPMAILFSFGNDFGFKDDQGEWSPNFWKNTINRHIIDNYSKKIDGMREALKSWNKTTPYLDKHNQPASKTFGAKFDVSLILQVVAGFQWRGFKGQGENLKKTFAFKAGIGIGVDLSGTLLWQFMAGPVPMYATLVPELRVVFSGLFMSTKELMPNEEDLKLTETKWQVEGDLNFTFDFILTVSVGVGMVNVLSLSVSGCVSLPMFFGFLERGHDGKPNPHFTAGVTFRLEIALQALFFKLSILVWSIKKDPFFDNWSDSEDGYLAEGAYGEDVWGDADPRFMLTMSDGSKRHSIIVNQDGQFLMDELDPFAHMQIVSDGEMACSYEATAVRAAADVEYDEASLPTAHRNMIPKVVVLEDGTLSTELVPCDGVNTFTFQTDEDEVSEEAQERKEGEEEQEQEEDAQVVEVEDADEAETEGAEDVEEGDELSSDDVPGDLADDVPVEPEGEETEVLATDEPDDPAIDDSEAPVADEPEVSLTEAPEDDVMAGTAEEAAVVGAVIANVAAEDDLPKESEEDAKGDEKDVPEAEGEELPEDSSKDEEHPEDSSEDEELPEESAEDEESIPWAGDPFLGFGAPVGEEFEYEPVAGKTTGAVCGEAGVQGFADHGGIEPTVDAVIFHDVHSDPRQKIVSINGVPYLFRIITVDYPLATSGSRIRRSRVVASPFDLSTRTWGNPVVIDYRSGNVDVPRIDTFDYDFDIVVKSEGSKWTKNAVACLVVTGGLRPSGDATGVYEAFASTTLSIVILDANLRVIARSVMLTDSLYATNESSKVHMAMRPCVSDGFAIQGASGALAFSYLHRSADSAEQLMTTAATASFGMGYAYLRDDNLSFTVATNKETNIDASVTGMEMVLGDGVSGSYDALVTLLFTKDQGYEVCSAVIPPDGSFADLVVRKCVTSSEVLPQICAWPGHGTFLYTKNRLENQPSNPGDYYLYEGAYDPLSTGQSGFVPNRVDTCGIKGASFTVSPTGKFLFYYDTFDGNAGKKEDPTTGELVDNKQTIYRIMALRYLNGKFCEDFPFCELGHPIDSFECTNISTEASVFLASEITDFDQSLADIHYIAIPNTLAADLTGFKEMEDFVYAGKECPFQLDVTNHGNLIIGGFDVELCDSSRGNAVVDTVHVGEIEPGSILLTASNRNWIDRVCSGEPNQEMNAAGDGGLRLSAEEQEGMLMPGKCISYKVKFKIPDDWRGEKDVLVRLRDIWTPGIQADPEATAGIKYIDEGEANAIPLHAEEVTSTLYHLQEDVEESDPGHHEDLPQTGDPSGLVSPLGLAISGLGSMLAAYSMRRFEVEQEESGACWEEGE